LLHQQKIIKSLSNLPPHIIHFLSKLSLKKIPLWPFLTFFFLFYIYGILLGPVLYELNQIFLTFSYYCYRCFQFPHVMGLLITTYSKINIQHLQPSF
jgi:hypothetical protein